MQWPGLVMILWIQLALGILLFVEQPAGSLMEAYFRFSHFAKNAFRPLHKVKVCLDEYGGETRKPLWIWSQFEFAMLGGYQFS